MHQVLYRNCHSRSKSCLAILIVLIDRSAALDLFVAQQPECTVHWRRHYTVQPLDQQPHTPPTCTTLTTPTQPHQMLHCYWRILHSNLVNQIHCTTHQEPNEHCGIQNAPSGRRRVTAELHIHHRFTPRTHTNVTGAHKHRITHTYPAQTQKAPLNAVPSGKAAQYSQQH
jgi:hypothetical protein